MNAKKFKRHNYEVQYRHKRRSWHWGGDHDTLELAHKHAATLSPYWDEVRILTYTNRITNITKV